LRDAGISEGFIHLGGLGEQIVGRVGSGSR